jgi:hypothetical protein
MKISKLLEIHDSVKIAGNLTNNIGDAYLCLKNPIYNIIRKQTLQAGFVFSSEQNVFYESLPLSQLSNILKVKKIPYANNVDVLRSLEEKISNTANVSDIILNLKKNFLFHESCHAFARSYSMLSDNSDLALNMLIEESFANTCELLGVIYAEDAAHRFFYELNSYTALFEMKTNLKKACDEMGIEIVATVIFFGYLQSNLLLNSFDEYQFNKIIELAENKNFKKISQAQIKVLKSLVRLCFTLDEEFRRVTTGFYLKLSGLELNINKANYIEKIISTKSYQMYVEFLIGVLKC